MDPIDAPLANREAARATALGKAEVILSLLSQSTERVRELEAALEAIANVAPGLPDLYRWTDPRDVAALFDVEFRHQNGKKPFDYLKAWLSMLRPFAVATRDDSWGEMEKLLCIVMRNYVRVAAAADDARQALSSSRAQPFEKEEGR